MGLFDRFRTKKIQSRPGDNRITIGWSYPAKRNTNDFLEAFHTNPRMNSVAMIASDVARSTFKLYNKIDYKKDKDSAKPIDSHVFLELVEDPAPDLVAVDWFTTMYLITASRLVAGEAFALIERDKAGRPRQLIYLPNTWVLSIPTQSEPYYRVSPLGNASRHTMNIMPYDMVYWREVNLSDPYNRGRARAERLGDEISADEYASKWALNTFFNSAKPEMVVSMPDAGKDAADRLQESWNSKFGGFRNSNKAAFTGSKLEIHKLTETAKELDFVESRKYLKQAIREEFAIPPELFGDVTNSNRATIDSADYLYKVNVLSRELERTEAVLNTQLMWQYMDDTILVFDNCVPDDEITRVGQIKEAFVANAVTTNEYRQVLKLPPIKGGDVLKPAIQPAQIPSVKACGHIDSVDVKKNFDSNKLGAIWKVADAAATATEAEYIAASKAWSEKQQADFMAAYREATKSGLKGMSAVDAALDKVFGLYADEAVKKGFTPAWVASMKKGAEIAQEILGTSINFDLLNPAFLQWVEKYGLDKAKYINGTTKEALRLTLMEGLAEGESIKKLTDRVNAVYKELNGTEQERWRAERIARTESASSVSAGQYETYLSEGVTTLVWIAGSEESGTRPAHAAVNGVEYNAADGILVGGEILKYPGDPNGSASNVIQCRCSVGAVV